MKRYVWVVFRSLAETAGPRRRATSGQRRGGCGPKPPEGAEAAAATWRRRAAGHASRRARGRRARRPRAHNSSGRRCRPGVRAEPRVGSCAGARSRGNLKPAPDLVRPAAELGRHGAMVDAWACGARRHGGLRGCRCDAGNGLAETARAMGNEEWRALACPRSTRRRGESGVDVDQFATTSASKSRASRPRAPAMSNTATVAGAGPPKPRSPMPKQGVGAPKTDTAQRGRRGHGQRDRRGAVDVAPTPVRAGE